MNTLLETLRIGGLRSRIELKQFMRQRESVVFTLFFPVILLFIFGTVFKDTIAPGVTFSQYFVAGMIASGLVNTFTCPAVALRYPSRISTVVVLPIVIILQFFSGVFFVFTSLPSFMQQLAAIFPLKWLTQGMRSVFLPDDFATQEVAGTWELEKTALVLLIWLVLGLIFAIKKFKWSRE